MIEPASAIAVCRFLHDGGLLLLWGTAAFVAALMPRRLAMLTVQRLSAFPSIAVAVVALTTLVALPLEAAAIGDGWSAALDPETLESVLFNTSVGDALQVQAIASVLLIAAFVLRREKRMAPLAVATAIGLGGLALTGHASMDQGWLSIVHRGNDIVHLLSGGAWVGALIPFLIVMKLLAAPDLHAEAQLALRRFSTGGHLAVALVLATGLVNTALILRGWPADWSSPYQVLLIVKIVVVCSMVCLAVVNRYVLVPAMEGDALAAVRAIRRLSSLEILFGVGAIGLVAVFGILDPA